MNEEIFKFLYSNLNECEYFIKKEILWVLSNISGGNLNHLNYFLKFNFINLIQNILSTILKEERLIEMNGGVGKDVEEEEEKKLDCFYSIKIEICYIFMNVSSSIEIINLKENFFKLFNQDLILIFNQILSSSSSSSLNVDEVQIHILKFFISISNYFQSNEIILKYFKNSILILKKHENLEILKLLEFF